MFLPPRVRSTRPKVATLNDPRRSPPRNETERLGKETLCKRRAEVPGLPLVRDDRRFGGRPERWNRQLHGLDTVHTGLDVDTHLLLALIEICELLDR